MNRMAQSATDSPIMTKDTSRQGPGHPRPSRVRLAGIVAGGLVALATIPLAAQTRTYDRDAGRRVLSASAQSIPGPRIELRAKDTVEKTYVRPRVSLRKRDGEAAKAFTPATIVVTYIGFSPAAENAFQAAVDVWEQLISSPVTIRVEATWEPLAPLTLGSAGPRRVRGGFPPPRDSTWYPDALADAIAGSDIEPGEPDILASFNSDFTDWYMGTDGATPPGKWDLVSVVLHEIGHGLGFGGSMIIDDGVFEAGVNLDECDGTAGNGCWGFGSGWPVIYDRFTQDTTGDFLIDTGVYTNPSAALGAVLVGGGVFFSGTSANVANGGTRPELYAPSPWEYGSSYAHLDEVVYAAGNKNSLMTPFLGSAEAIHDPGPVTLGIFEDIGWEVGGAIFSDGFESGNVSAWSGSVP